MSNTIIKVENLSKLYRIGTREQGYKTFREAIVDGLAAPIRNFKRLRKLTKFDDAKRQAPSAKHHAHSAMQSSQDDVIWALKDVSFEVKQGEVVGIIGRNGAGKSTLLKILTRITEPTSGSVKLYGRVSSLLEVGTGFHPELTGRENIYLNGAILGMRKSEIDGKFDEIVTFAEIEKFIDTPVKRYSSGMYVRLAFAVAAHLEPEILLVDEVLAVGDVAFQKKCLGKMGEVASEGRTVLFVSHNMAAIQTLCQRAIRLDMGSKRDDGLAGQVVERYLSEQLDSLSSFNLEQRPDHRGNGNLRILSMQFESQLGINVCPAGAPATVKMMYSWNSEPTLLPSNIGFTIWTMTRQPVAECKTAYATESIVLGYSRGWAVCELASLPLMPGQYLVDFCVKFSGEIYDWVENALILTVKPSDYLGGPKIDSSVGAVVLLRQDWRSLPLSKDALCANISETLPNS
ncbi:MAG: ABC transporter ATP-binding protein [Proteobacteria bacterium]|nr:ABC transporter ATP-binding protein [Pseudomonadota bacterium]